MLQSSKKVVDNKSRIDLAKYTSGNVSEQIKLADTKAAWTFSVLGLLTAVMTNILSKYTVKELLAPKVMIFGIIAIISLILAFKNIIMVIYPRVGSGSIGGLLYFKDIILSTKEEYSQNLDNASEEQVIKALQGQTYELAKIADKKFSSLKTAIISCMFALGWIVITVIMLT